MNPLKVLILINFEIWKENRPQKKFARAKFAPAKFSWAKFAPAKFALGQN